ncbi:MAG TPA: histidine kinase [Bacteroidales bacterium]
MNHPILESFRKTIAYLITWLVFAVISFFFLYFKHHLSLEGSILNSIMVNLFFAVMGLTIWYAVYYSYPEKIGISNVIINHCISASVIILFLVGSVTLFNKVLLNPYDANFIQQHIKGFVFTCLIFYITAVLVYYNIVYNYYLKQRKENEERLLSIIKQTELDMLKSQINPHFLFNSLNSISSLTITNPAKAQEMIIKLSDYLRYSIKYNSTQLTTLQAELDNMLRYLDIEKGSITGQILTKIVIRQHCR